MTDLHKMLKILRVENNETQADMAKRLSISASSLSMKAHGSRPMTEDLVRQIIQEYNIPEPKANLLLSALQNHKEECP